MPNHLTHPTFPRPPIIPQTSPPTPVRLFHAKKNTPRGMQDQNDPREVRRPRSLPHAASASADPRPAGRAASAGHARIALQRRCRMVEEARDAGAACSVQGTGRARAEGEGQRSAGVIDRAFVNYGIATEVVDGGVACANAAAAALVGGRTVHVPRAQRGVINHKAVEAVLPLTRLRPAG